MILLVSGTTASVRRLAPTSGGRLGVLLTPDTGNSVKTTVRTGLKWACDNAAYTGFKPSAFLRMLAKVADVDEPPLWVACPDVVANEGATFKKFVQWEPVIRCLNLPVAFVAQDGLLPNKVPWHRIACLFIGGSTKWKLGAEAAEVAREAKERGKWLQVGRVNSLRRIELAYRMGADSFDGGAANRFGDTHIPRFLRWMRHLERQPALWS